MADGLRIVLHPTDVDHLVLFANFIGSAAAIKPVWFHNGRYEERQITVYSKALCEDLRSLGLIPRRAERNISLPRLPSHLEPHLLRGLVDGDGCIRRDARSHFFLSGWCLWLAGSVAVTERFADFIEHMTGHRYLSIRNGRNTRNRQLLLQGPTALCILAHLYEAPDPVLKCHAGVVRVLIRHYELAKAAGLSEAWRGDGHRFVNKRLAKSGLNAFLRELRVQISDEKYKRWFLPK